MIHGLSQRRRLPRLGKIRLGVTVARGDKHYPRATDYFVCPPEVQAKLGEKPRALPIMFPIDDPELIFPQVYKAYKTAGLWCAGDGQSAKRWDTTGNLEERECPCPLLESGKCSPEATLNFFLPSVPGIGVWQITTGNKTSIVGINSGLELYSRIFGGLRGIPFTLVLEPMKTERFDKVEGQMVATTIHCMRLTTEKTLLEVVEWRHSLGAHVDQLMLPAADADELVTDRPAPEPGVGPGETIEGKAETIEPPRETTLPSAMRPTAAVIVTGAGRIDLDTGEIIARAQSEVVPGAPREAGPTDSAPQGPGSTAGEPLTTSEEPPPTGALAAAPVNPEPAPAAKAGPGDPAPLLAGVPTSRVFQFAGKEVRTLGLTREQFAETAKLVVAVEKRKGAGTAQRSLAELMGVSVDDPTCLRVNLTEKRGAKWIEILRHLAK